jgi:hypothetical protein
VSAEAAAFLTLGFWPGVDGFRRGCCFMAILFGIIQDVRPPAHGWLEYTINGINRQILFDTGNKPRRDRNLIGMREYGLWILLAQCYERNGCLPHFSPVNVGARPLVANPRIA